MKVGGERRWGRGSGKKEGGYSYRGLFLLMLEHSTH
jgi:hypothetical protein